MPRAGYTRYNFMTSRNNSIDGFSLRRRSASDGAPPREKLGLDRLSVPERFVEAKAQPLPTHHAIDQRPKATTISEPEAGRGAAGHSLSSEIHESLRSIDEEKPPKPRRRLSKKTWKRLFITVLLIGLLGMGYIGAKAILAGGNVFSGNLFEVFANRPLKKDQFGRSNILLFGTSEDDPDHDGADLTDSIMVISVDQEKKNAIMFSVPRDLWVDYGQACLAGYSGKINALYECAKNGTSDRTGAEKLKQKVGEVFGIDIQYYAKVNYTALKDAVNAVGGITVTIDSDDPRGVYDPNFDWQCNFRCKMVKWPNGQAQLDGEHALALARARNAAGGYGLSGGNFDREQYQQKIILAIKDKAASAGTLANPVAVAGLIDSVGNNVETNFQTAELKTLVDITGGIDKASIRTVSLIDNNVSLVTTGNYGGQSIVRPAAGLEDFSDIQAYIHRLFGGNVEVDETATIEVLNGTDTPGVASKKEIELESKGLIITSIGDAPTSSSYGKLQWFDMTSGAKPKTAKKIQDVVGKPSSGAALPRGVQSSADFVIIIGT